MIETIIAILYMSFVTLCLLTIIVCIISIIKTEVTYRNQMIIAKAIYDYSVQLIEKGQYDRSTFPVKYEDMEDFEVTLKRFWDWGYKRILSPEKFELIKPYIKPYKEIKNA